MNFRYEFRETGRVCEVDAGTRLAGMAIAARNQRTSAKARQFYDAIVFLPTARAVQFESVQPSESLLNEALQRRFMISLIHAFFEPIRVIEDD